MPPIVLGMVAIAAVLHAAWNVILKTGGDPLGTAARAMAGATILFTPLVVVAWVATGMPAIPAWSLGLGIVSGLVETLYFVALSNAYRRGELSTVYPIARGTAPLLAVLVGVALLGERLPPGAALGVGALAGGILVVQRPWRALRPVRAGGTGVDHAVLFALATGVAIATYSAIDSVGVRGTAPWLYGAVTFWVTAATLVVWTRFVDRAGKLPAARPPAPWRRATMAGLMTLSAYLIILAAYSIAPLTIVAPLREGAVLLGSLWGSYRLGEAAGRGDGWRRVAGAGLVVLGAILVGTS